MARGVNKAIIVGTLGRDPNVGQTKSGDIVVDISVATNESWTDKVSGEKQEATEWHQITLFGRLAEVTKEYLRKGMQVYVEGKIQTNKKTNADGQDRYYTQIIAHTIQFLDRKPPQNQQPPQRPESGNEILPF